MKILIIFCLVLATSVADHHQRLHQFSHHLHEFTLKTHTPCLVAAVHSHGLTWTGSFGPGADLENHVLCSEKTMLKVASVSKSIGSALLAHLVEQGQLDWDQDISKYLPIFPQKKFNGKPVNITLRQLVTHQSGVRNSNDQKDFMHDWEFRILNATGLLQMFSNDPLLFKPGHGFHYSNHGWSLIGAIVESVTGNKYHEELEKFMRTTVGMATATSENRDRLIRHRGQQYRVDHDGHVSYAPITDQTRPFPHWPAGGVVANVHDLITYGRRILAAYRNESIGHVPPFLNQSTVEEMWTYVNHDVPATHYNMNVTMLDGSTKTVKGIESRYVMGWERSQFPENAPEPLKNLTYISHTGETGGVNAKLAIIPEHEFVFAAIANRGGLKDHLQHIPIDAFNILFQ